MNPDKHLGAWNIPNNEHWDLSECFQTQVVTNSLGLRDREYSMKKPARTFRIVVVGDSFVKGVGVPFKKVFHKILETRMSKNFRGMNYDNFELINFGASGFGTGQELILFNKLVLQFEPDIVLLSFFRNDVMENSSLLLPQYKLGYPRPFFKIENGKLVYIPFETGAKNKLYSIKQFLRIHSYLYNFVADRIKRIPRLSFFVKRLVTSEPKRGTYGKSKIPIPYIIYRKYLDDLWKDAWRITFAEIIEMNRSADSIRAKFVIIYLPSGLEVHDYLWREFIEKYPQAGSYEWDLEMPGKLLSEFAKKHDLLYLNLFPGFKKTIEQTGERIVFECDGHWNENGHRIAANLIYYYLINNHFIGLERINSTP